MKKISRPSAVATAMSPHGLTGSPARGEISYEETAVPTQYPHRLSLYLHAPTYEISIDDFEELALARLERTCKMVGEAVLKAVETAGIRNLRDDDLFSWIRKYEQKHLPLHGNNVAGRFPLFEERRRDEAAHFILRLAFCGSVPNESTIVNGAVNALATAEDGRRWFVAQETMLLRYRLMMLAESRAEREDFLASSLAALSAGSCAIVQLSLEEKRALTSELQLIHSAGVLEDDFYQVGWELVPDLVGRRSVLLKRGRAFVPRSDCMSIILNRFREELETSLEKIAREVPFLRDDRLIPLLDALRRCDYSLDAAMSNAGGGVSTVVGQLAAVDVDKAAVHFPPCMQHLHRNLRADRHLKFGGRQQFGLFLKAVGLPLTEALVFWRAAFAPRFTTDQFNKDYAYNVRHNYGQEGKRANYTSYSCSKICSSPAPSAGEYSGCPFKHTASGEKLAAILEAYTGPNGTKLTAAQVKEVVALGKDGSHYQLACTRVFEMTRPRTTGSVPTETVTYPHKYYEASVLSTNVGKK